MHKSYEGLLEDKYVKDEWKAGDNWRRNLDSDNDDSPRYYKNIRLKENITKEEKDNLLLKVKLDDGTIGDVVTCYRIQNSWRYVCHTCNICGSVWEKFSQHINGRKHKESLLKQYHPKDKFLIKYENEKTSKRENSNEKQAIEKKITVCKIQSKLDDCYKPLIGLEYLLEIDCQRATCDHYCCLLCDKQGTFPALLIHLLSQNHQSCYLKKFFPKAAEKLELFHKFGVHQNHELFAMLTEHVVARIEYVLGRLKPSQVKLDMFENNKKSLLDKIENGKHLKEISVRTFVECVDIAHLNKTCCCVGWKGRPRLSRQRTDNKIKPLMDRKIDPLILKLQDNREIRGKDHQFDRNVPARDVQEQGNNDYDRKSRWRHVSPRTDGDRSRQNHVRGNSVESPQESYTRFDEEERKFYEYTHSGTNTNLWHNYTERVQLIEEHLLEELKYYQESPEKHPRYDEEFKVYWNKRNKELIAMGENPRNYDIKVEWNAFWEIQLNEWFKDLFEKEKAQLRQQLQFLQIESSTKAVDSKTHVKPMDYDKSVSNKRYFDSTSRNSRYETSKKQKMSPSNSYEASSRQSSHVPVIPVLRKLSVLEHNLGSLGPKVVNLLSTALTLEKTMKNGADAVMSSEENCVLLETVKEKLKGFIQSGLMQEAMVTVAEAAIKSVLDLLKSSAAKKEKSSISKNRRPRSNSRKQHSNEQKSSFKEKIRSSNEQKKNSRPHSREGRSLSKERRLYSREQRLCSNEQRSQFVEWRALSDERKPRSGERKPRSGERKPRSGERKPLSGERKPRSGERKPRSGERKPRSGERRPRSSERRPRSSERRPHPIERRPRSNDRSPFPSERNSYTNDRSPFPNERNSYTNERRPHSTEKNSYTNNRYANEEGSIYTKEVFMTDVRNQAQNTLTLETIKVPEIALYVDKLGSLSHLTFLQKTAISQQIVALLLLRGVTDITEDELLLLIKMLLPNSAQNSFLSIPESGNSRFSRINNLFPSTNISGRKLPNRGTSILPSLLDISTSTTFQNVYPSYGQSTSTFGGGANNKVPAATTYSLSADSYKSSDYRKY